MPREAPASNATSTIISKNWRYIPYRLATFKADFIYLFRYVDLKTDQRSDYADLIHQVLDQLQKVPNLPDVTPSAPEGNY